MPKLSTHGYMKLRALLLVFALELGFLNGSMAEDALDHWYFTDARVVSKIRFLGGQFVGVGTNGLILTSPDGKAWTARNSGTANNLTSVAWASGPPYPAAGLYVVVGKTATILTSTNSINWQVVSTPYTCDLNDVALSGNFVAATTTCSTNVPNFLVSGTGDSWAGTFVPWNPINGCFSVSALTAAGVIIAAGGISCCAYDIWRSYDGIYWDKVGFSNQIISGIAYGNNRFVMVGVNGFPLVSTNGGDSWSSSVDTNICTCYLACCYTGQDIAFGNSTFVVPRGYVKSGLLTTVDGVSWTNRPALAGLSINTIAFGNGHFVAAGESGIYRAELPPRIAAALATGSNALHLTVTTESGRSYRLQSSSNFTLWTDAVSFTGYSIPSEFYQPIDTNRPALFYRVFAP
jgi:hypothetical protein